MNNYDPDKTILVLGGINIVGFTEDDIEVEFNDPDSVKEKVGFKGEHSFTENLDRSGFIKFVLKETSPSNVVMEGFDKSKVSIPVLLKDSSDSKLTVISDGARVKNRPTRARGKEEGDVEWMVACPKLVSASI